MLTAEYGGSGGKPIETGMVVEEPDIEIGAGVSSKGTTLLSFSTPAARCLYSSSTFTTSWLPPFIHSRKF